MSFVKHNYLLIYLASYYSSARALRTFIGSISQPALTLLGAHTTRAIQTHLNDRHEPLISKALTPNRGI